MTPPDTSPPAPPAADAPAQPLDAAAVKRALAAPADDRLALAHLLEDSVHEGFTSLEDAERRDRDELHRRIEEVVSGKAKLFTPEEVFDAIRRKLEEVRRGRGADQG